MGRDRANHCILQRLCDDLGSGEAWAGIKHECGTTGSMGGTPSMRHWLRPQNDCLDLVGCEDGMGIVGIRGSLMINKGCTSR